MEEHVCTETWYTATVQSDSCVLLVETCICCMKRTLVLLLGHSSVRETCRGSVTVSYRAAPRKVAKCLTISQVISTKLYGKLSYAYF
jgi:hypothetical protein